LKSDFSTQGRFLLSAVSKRQRVRRLFLGSTGAHGLGFPTRSLMGPTDSPPDQSGTSHALGVTFETASTRRIAVRLDPVGERWTMGDGSPNRARTGPYEMVSDMTLSLSLELSGRRKLGGSWSSGAERPCLPECHEAGRERWPGKITSPKAPGAVLSKPGLLS